MSYSETLIVELEQYAKQLRRDTLEMIFRRQSGHPGGSLSAAEIIAALIFHELKINPRNPGWPERDRLLLSKGHASAVLYAALARKGFFPFEDLHHWGELDCHLQAHPDRLKTPGVDMTTGLLGHGIAIGVGLALAGRMKNLDYRVFALVGDGECQAGIIWEGMMSAAKYHLSNLHLIVDNNELQLDGAVHQIMPLSSFADKWRAFGWEVLEIDGHNMRQILGAFEALEKFHDRPSVIIANTTKGKGVSFMENDARWHGTAPNPAEFELAMKELA